MLGADGRSSAVDKRGNASADAASSTRSGLDTDLDPHSLHTFSAWGESRCALTASDPSTIQHAGIRDSSQCAQLHRALLRYL